MFAEATTSEDLKELSDAKNLIAHLYSSMNVEQHQIEQEKELLKKLEHLKMELAPMEEVQQSVQWFSGSKVMILFKKKFN